VKPVMAGTAALLVALTAAVTPAHAQKDTVRTPDHIDSAQADTTPADTSKLATGVFGGMLAPNSGFCAVMTRSPDDPEAALANAEALGLSAAVRARLETARDRVRQTHAQARRQLQAADQALGTAASSTATRIDETTVRNAVRGVADAHAEVIVAKLQARAETRAALTAEQRNRLGTLVRAPGDHMARGPHHMGRDSAMGMRRDTARMRGDSMPGHRGAERGDLMMGMVMAHCDGMSDDHGRGGRR
jgi:hypothetical protein